MIRMLRSSALSLALTYVALGIVALVLFAAPLWYAWQVTIQDSRTELLQIDSQRLAEVLRREGAQGAKAFIDARVRMQIAGERILLLTDASLHPLSGNLPAWPSTCLRNPGATRSRLNWAIAACKRPWCTSPRWAATICWSAGTTRSLRRCKRA